MQLVDLRGNLGRLVQRRVDALEMMRVPQSPHRVRSRVMVVTGHLLVSR